MFYSGSAKPTPPPPKYECVYRSLLSLRDDDGDEICYLYVTHTNHALSFSPLDKAKHINFKLNLFSRLEHIKMYEKHKGHESMHMEMVVILLVTLIIAQIVLVEWKKRHYRSYSVSCHHLTNGLAPLIGLCWILNGILTFTHYPSLSNS